MLREGRFQEALDVSLYVMQVRLADPDWIECVPLAIMAAERTGSVGDLAQFFVQQVLATPAGYPETDHLVQSSLLVGVLNEMIERGHIGAAQSVLELIVGTEERERYADEIASFSKRIGDISEAKGQATQ